ncbi:ribosome biogenesis GTP-binding protein YsxC [Colletotrichum plurivorum]|uniref:Ribosome biogenesis GTP-binding protein YsxC n=1 Tax=Colletotrichum plurivorum TaxID=2175906 RepID=A0A8H6NPQ7_9PEZI|nr:ribosome biogenesis GTP-binding protein YsxC [Colletotrichum plurivorum]
MLNAHVRGCRVSLQNLRPPPRRWLSGRPTRAYNSPRPSRDGFESERRRPSGRYDETRDRGFDRGRDQRFSAPRAGPSRMDRHSPRAQSRAPPPEREPFQPRKSEIEMIPELPQEEKDKVGTSKAVWDARSLYFVPPTRQEDPRAQDSGTIVARRGRDVPYALAARFFLQPPAKFLYSAFRFKDHPVNTTTPEICIVGASNCGKSTFVNALTGAAPSKTLAQESDRAGKTVSMNAYGVGSLAGLPPRRTMSPEGAGEAAPTHGMLLVDTPGYGHASRTEWGREIAEYLEKRTMLRGVVLLLSAEKRVSQQDWQIMRMLADAGRPAMVVFTKMDKALREGRKGGRGGIAERLREVERCFAKSGWDGWVPKVPITAAKMERGKGWKYDPTRSEAGMAGVRMAVLEMAGIKEHVAPEKFRGVMMKSAKEMEEADEAPAPGKEMESDPAAWSGDVISFEELEKQFGPWNK